MGSMRAPRAAWGLGWLGVAVGLHLAAPPAPRAASADCAEDNTGPVCKIVETCYWSTIRWPVLPGFNLVRVCDPPEYYRLPGTGGEEDEEDAQDPRLE